MCGRESGVYAASVALLLGLAPCVHAQLAAPVPYASIASDGEGYAGPGRGVANDITGQVIRIGLLAPLHGVRKAEGEAMVAGARMALRDAAPEPLGRGRRVELAIEDSNGTSWGVVSDAVIRLVFDDESIVMITSTSAADTHLCEQVGNRIGVPVLTLSSDPTTTQINIPWIFRVGPGDAKETEAAGPDTVAEGGEATNKSREFVTRFRRFTGVAPSRAASETYDAVTLVVHALQKTGPNRARVRDQLAKANNYDGVSSKISFDREGNNRAAFRPPQPR